MGNRGTVPAKKRTDLLLALLLTAALFVPVVVKFDLYYDLNDDVLIKDVLSGVYSGTPEGHTMQILYPLSVCLSLLYRVLPIPVFGIFLALCQYGSIFLIAYRTARRCRARRAKLLALLAEGVFWAAAFGSHLVFLQYTVAAGMLACVAIFWMLTAESGGSDGVPLHGAVRFLWKNLPALGLYWVAFCLREEMALLLLPLAGVAGLCKWGQERRVFTGENVQKYFLTFCSLMLGLVVLWGLDELAYAEEDWSAFRQFFEERTELYDYQKDFIDNYEENEAYYEALGVSRQQQTLLANYNFGVDDSIDETLLARLREAAVNRPDAGGLFKKGIRESLWSLLYEHWAEVGELPCNIVLVLCGCFAFAGVFLCGKRRLWWQAPLCGAAGASLWLFLIMRGRLEERVMHPLYLAQILVFVGLFLAEREEADCAPQKGDCAPKKKGVPLIVSGYAPALLCVLVLAACLPQTVKTADSVSEEYTRREVVNQTNEAVLAYCSAHPDALFLEDVYSTVAYSEKILVDRSKPFNYDLLGGWLVKSPLTEQKLSAFGYASMEEAVCAGEPVNLLAETENDMQWLQEYFNWRQLPLQVVKLGSITEGVDLYQVQGDTGEEADGKEE